MKSIRVKLGNVTHAAKANANGMVGTACGMICDIKEIVNTTLLSKTPTEVDCMTCLVCMAQVET